MNKHGGSLGMTLAMLEGRWDEITVLYSSGDYAVILQCLNIATAHTKHF